MNTVSSAEGAAAHPGLFARFGEASRRARQWRLLLLWLLGLGVPLLLVTIPTMLALGTQLDHSLLGATVVGGYEITLLAEVGSALARRGSVAPTMLGAALVLLLLMPWLTGITMTAVRSSTPLRFAALLSGGLAEYWRMVRLWIWALLPLGIAVGIGAGLIHVADQQALTMTLQSDAERLGKVALLVGALLFLLALCTVDAARAQLVLEPRRRSVIAAWWRATRMLLKRPGRVVLYLLITAAGLIAAALLGWLRIQVPPISGLGFALALLLGQALVLALAWMRCARLFALVASARGEGRIG